MPHRKAPPVTHDAPRMRGERGRNPSGPLRQKRGDTLVGTIEEQYHVNLNRRSDMKLETLRKELGVTGIDEIIEADRKR